MNGELANIDSAAAHEVASDVVDDLVRVDIRVVVRRRDGERVIVELAWHEAANHEVARLEGEVDGRRLVDAAGDRLEVADVEGEWPQVAVPPDQVERVVGVVIGSHPPASLDLDHEISGLEVGRHLLW